MSTKLVFLRPDSPSSDFEAYTTNPSALRRLIVRYTTGECAVLAGRIHELTGWPIVRLLDRPARPFPVHYANRRPDGGLVDITGRYPRGLDMLAARSHGCGNPAWLHGSALPLNSNDRRRAKTVLNTPWGFYLVPYSERL